VETITDLKIVKANKDHKCNLCCGDISKGETYNHAVYKESGEIYSWKIHLHCNELTHKLNMFEYDNTVNSNNFANYIEDYISAMYLKDKVKIILDHLSEKERVKNIGKEPDYKKMWQELRIALNNDFDSERAEDLMQQIEKELTE
jgi:hypothetical protein